MPEKLPPRENSKDALIGIVEDLGDQAPVWISGLPSSVIPGKIAHEFSRTIDYGEDIHDERTLYIIRCLWLSRGMTPASAPVLYELYISSDPDDTDVEMIVGSKAVVVEQPDVLNTLNDLNLQWAMGQLQPYKFVQNSL